MLADTITVATFKLLTMQITESEEEYGPDIEFYRVSLVTMLRQGLTEEQAHKFVQQLKPEGLLGLVEIFQSELGMLPSW